MQRAEGEGGAKALLECEPFHAASNRSEERRKGNVVGEKSSRDEVGRGPDHTGSRRLWAINAQVLQQPQH